MGQGKERQEPYFVIIQRGEIRIVAETHRSQLWLSTFCEALIRWLRSWYICYSGFTCLARDTFCFPSMTLLACSSLYWQRHGCCYYTALASDIDEIKAEKLHYTFFFFVFVKVLLSFFFFSFGQHKLFLFLLVQAGMEQLFFFFFSLIIFLPLILRYNHNSESIARQTGNISCFKIDGICSLCALLTAWAQLRAAALLFHPSVGYLLLCVLPS